MSSEQPSLRRAPRTRQALPVIDETPTLRLGSMLQTAYPVNLPERGPAPLSAEELDALGRIPKQRWPLFVFTAAVLLAALCAATWPKTRIIIATIAMMPLESENRWTFIQPLNTSAVNKAPAEIHANAKSAQETAPESPPPPPSLRIEAEPSARPDAEIPKRPRRSPSTRRSHSIPLRGYAWSSVANALVPIEPAEPADRHSAEVAPGKE